MEKGYTNFTEISEHYIYSFTYGKFLRKKAAVKKFGWKKPLQIAIQERLLRDMEAELDYVEDNAEELKEKKVKPKQKTHVVHAHIPMTHIPIPEPEPVIPSTSL